MDNYLFSSAANTFTNVAICVYVFDTKSEEWDKDIEYFESVLDSLRRYNCASDAESEEDDYPGDSGKTTKKINPDSLPGVCILINKMDLEDPSERARIEREKRDDLIRRVKDRLGGKVMAFGTSIWDESLYKVSGRSLSEVYGWMCFLIMLLAPGIGLVSDHPNPASKFPTPRRPSFPAL